MPLKLELKNQNKDHLQTSILQILYLQTFLKIDKIKGNLQLLQELLSLFNIVLNCLNRILKKLLIFHRNKNQKKQEIYIDWL
ncbi:unnamed protein product [Paramecium pentaurelia]|uniref:Uncharacterized protein n=1 Tax=Paramecium pentaurelia TaxID=43138 RepID=A0A8S1UGU9_9CILI|nr:unnamed protein product [Paramecium pentaurelia]